MNDRSRLLDAWPLVVSLAFLLALLAALGLAMTRATGGHLVYPLDDTYIQMAIAKNLAAHGTWGVTRFDFSGAGSSPLWPLLIATLDRLTGRAEVQPLLANGLGAIAVVVLAWFALARHVASRRGQALALGLVIVAAPLPALALAGMEHTLQCAATLALAMAGASLCAGPPAPDWRRVTWVALLGLAAMAVRYDDASIVAALVVLIAVACGWQYAVPLVIGSVLPAAAYASMAWRHGWPALPAPILLKQRLLGIQPFSWHGAADLLGGGALTVLVGTPALFVLVLAAIVFVLTHRRVEDTRGSRETLFLLLVFLIATAVHVQFGRVGWLYRYEAYLVVLGVVANAAALARVMPAQWPRLDALRWTAAAALAVILIHPLLLRAFLASRETVTSAADLYRNEYIRSMFFQQYPPAGGLLVGDVGAIAYFTDVPIVDAGGLATRELLPASWSEPIDVKLAVRVARSRGVRVSLIDGPQEGAATGWRCVAAWTTLGDPTPNATVWLAAADDEAGRQLARDLRTFATDHPDGGFTLRFADARGNCHAR